MEYLRIFWAIAYLGLFYACVLIALFNFSDFTLYEKLSLGLIVSGFHCLSTLIHDLKH